jgi:hypothetical protein
MKTYVTFGQCHAHRVNNQTFDKDCVAVIKAPTADEGREIAFELFKGKFFTTYGESEFDMTSMRYYPRGFINAN